MDIDIDIDVDVISIRYIYLYITFWHLFSKSLSKALLIASNSANFWFYTRVRETIILAY